MKKKFIAFFCLAIVLVSCNSKEDLTTDTYSHTFSNKEEKMAFLEKYYSSNVPYKDVAYHIVYHDNGAGRSVPGPSDWYMWIALKLEEEDVDHCMSDTPFPKSIELSAWSDILPKTDNWSVDGKKKYCENGDIWVVDNAILLRMVSNN